MTEMAWEALYDRDGLVRPCMTEVAWEALYDRRW